MLIKFTKHIQSHFSFLQRDKFYIAVSGGIDSMVLLHLFQHFQFSFGVLHCNFKLRGEESDADMRFIHDYCEENNIQLRIGFFETEMIAKELKESIQVTARKLRYNWFYEQMVENDVQFVATAHHLDDSLETFLINLSRGTGIDGLTGIPEINDQIIRPLLPFSREEIEQYAKVNNIQWREDASNATTKYLRNKLRHDVVPILKEINPEFLSSFQKTISHLNDTKGMADDASYIVYKEVATEIEDTINFDLNKLLQIPNYKTYLHSFLKQYDFTAWNDIYDLVTAQSGKQVFSNTHVLLKDRNKLILSERKAASNNEVYFIDSIESKVNIPLKLSFTRFSGGKNVNANCIFVDKDKIKFPLTIRKWQDGDYFYPFGMTGKKKLSKYFKDEKFSLLDKENQWLLCSADQIVWVIGKRADNRFKTQKTTQNIIKIEVK
ncbi:tRNA lysidine(34) synthetase TilS [Flavobacterium sp. LMO8]|nr:tRNA lysidine(34) synthetase TilS [Flavobacterium sp. LMO8]MQP24357.1 tRNA lysidine(34) synthetase TilS [Flavobacterium sp. LMO8]